MASVTARAGMAMAAGSRPAVGRTPVVAAARSLAPVRMAHALAARTALAGSGASLLLRPPRQPAAAARRGPATPRAMTVTQEVVTVETPTGPMRCYVYRPAAPGKYPGLLLYSEIFQVTGPIRRSAQMMACHGFLVIVPEIYHEYEPAGTVLPYDGEVAPGVTGADRGNELKITKTIAGYDSDSAAALKWLAAQPTCTGKLGVMGFCIGGHLAFRGAMNEGVQAAACFYATDIHKRSLGKGMKDNSLDRCGELAAHGTEMLMIWGRQDPHVSREGRELVLAAMNAAGVHHTWLEFNGQHAFMRDEGHRYDGELARVCYGLCVDLFRRKLTEGDVYVPAPAGAAAKAESKH